MTHNQQARLAHEQDMTEYYEAAGLDRLSQRSRELTQQYAGEIADTHRAAAERDPGRAPGPGLDAEREYDHEAGS